jgi:hypothetical protein
MRKTIAATLVAAALCGCAGPAKQEYVLGAAHAPQNACAVQTALPVVQVERVLLPDYLDSREILIRNDRQVVSSETGRWAERLSLGTTRVLAASLAAQLNGVAVTSEPPIDPPVLRVVVDVRAFDATAGGPVVLAARWTITDGSGQRSLAAQQTTVTEAVSGARDGAVVAAMSRALEKLANAISAGIQPNLARGDVSRRASTSNLPERQLSCVI